MDRTKLTDLYEQFMVATATKRRMKCLMPKPSAAVLNRLAALAAVTTLPIVGLSVGAF